jgi:iron complex transport system permease protein
MSKETDFINNSRFKWLTGWLLLLSILLMIGSLAIGFYKISLKDLFIYLIKGHEAVSYEVAVIITNIRIPRIIAAYTIGAGLSIAGAAYQGLFKNPLVSPDILGVSTGAGFGAALAISLRLSDFIVQTSAFVFGIIAVILAYFVGSRAKFGQTVGLILAGSMIGALASSLISLLLYFANPNDTLPAITFWLMGSLSKVTPMLVYLGIIPIIIGSIVIYILRWRLNVLTMGDDDCRAMGIEPKYIRIITVSAATVISASAVCLGGMIGWVGLMIPHLSRGIVGADYRKMLPVSALMGGSFLLLMDNLARSLFTMEIPIGVLTAVMGAPFFVILILKQQRG